MALPVAHSAVALGISRQREPRVVALVLLVAILPDFDFALVWGLGLPVDVYHRTFSHSLVAALLLSALYSWFRPPSLKSLAPGVFFVVLISHSLLDILCTADAADHGVMLFWPVSDLRIGWPVLVPLYRQFAESPFSWPGSLRFTVLELLLAGPLWAGVRVLRNRFADEANPG